MDSSMLLLIDKKPRRASSFGDSLRFLHLGRNANPFCQTCQAEVSCAGNQHFNQRSISCPRRAVGLFTIDLGDSRHVLPKICTHMYPNASRITNNPGASPGFARCLLQALEIFKFLITLQQRLLDSRSTRTMFEGGTLSKQGTLAASTGSR